MPPLPPLARTGTGILNTQKPSAVGVRRLAELYSAAGQHTSAETLLAVLLQTHRTTAAATAVVGHAPGHAPGWELLEADLSARLNAARAAQGKPPTIAAAPTASPPFSQA